MFYLSSLRNKNPLGNKFRFENKTLDSENLVEIFYGGEELGDCLDVELVKLVIDLKLISEYDWSQN